MCIRDRSNHTAMTAFDLAELHFARERILDLLVHRQQTKFYPQFKRKGPKGLSMSVRVTRENSAASNTTTMASPPDTTYTMHSPPPSAKRPSRKAFAEHSRQPSEMMLIPSKSELKKTEIPTHKKMSKSVFSSFIGNICGREKEKDEQLRGYIQFHYRNSCTYIMYFAHFSFTQQVELLK
eukprot:TRINITY_DN7185_c0_g1_i7.p1 TRINITY_DN7185_c0_g1~~TRINITY_DN7185_c0_g1_i7.p1  ORF type:complete len:180 (+),score=6.76 TRINITY_DN7185_c0_g1_i7:118-657(+)